LFKQSKPLRCTGIALPTSRASLWRTVSVDALQKNFESLSRGSDDRRATLTRPYTRALGPRAFASENLETIDRNNLEAVDIHNQENIDTHNGSVKTTSGLYRKHVVNRSSSNSFINRSSHTSTRNNRLRRSSSVDKNSFASQYEGLRSCFGSPLGHSNSMGHVNLGDLEDGDRDWNSTSQRYRSLENFSDSHILSAAAGELTGGNLHTPQARQSPYSSG
jgi:hypothetical protein